MSEQGTVYSAFIHDQLNFERSRNESLTQRGVRLQQSASLTIGVFVTALGLLLGKDLRMDKQSLTLFAATVTTSVLSLLLGIGVTRLLTQEVADAPTLQLMLNERWGDDIVDSRNSASWLEAKTIAWLRPGNNRKAFWLSLGLWMQAGSVILGAMTFALVAAGAFALPN